MDILLVVRISNLRDTPPCVARGTKEKERSKHEAHDSATHAAGYKSDLYICQKDSIYALFQIIQETKKHDSRFIGLVKALTTRHRLAYTKYILLMDFFFLE